MKSHNDDGGTVGLRAFRIELGRAIATMETGGNRDGQKRRIERHAGGDYGRRSPFRPHWVLYGSTLLLVQYRRTYTPSPITGRVAVF